MSQSSGSPKAQKQTLIEDETQFQGVLVSECPIVVKGTVDGEVSGPSLQVSESGAVSGTVKVKALNSQGSLSGTIEADEINLSGKVQDKTVIRARALEVKLASESRALEVTFGECDLEVGDVPKKEDAVSEALTSEKAEKEAPAAETPAAEAPAAETQAAAEAPGDAKQAADEAGDASEDETDGSDGKKRRAKRQSTSPTPA